MLNPLTEQVLDRVPRAGVRRILDIGCGQGHTTRLLAAHFPSSTVTGLEYDPALVAHASANPDNSDAVNFERGDAAALPYGGGSFDLVFTRYLLLHVPEPSRVVSEMFRVARPGGCVVAYEPDCCIEFSYPSVDAMARMSYLWQNLFAHPLMGRQLVPLFKAAGARNLLAGAILGMDYEEGLYQRWYRLTAEAVGQAAVAKQLMTQAEFDDLLEEARQLEANRDSICFKLPDVWVIANR